MGAMSSKEQPPRPPPPQFPIPATVTPSGHVHDEELARRMQALHVGPPSNPPPGWSGGFNIPISVLSQHDPFARPNARPSGPPLPQPMPYGGSYPKLHDSPVSGPPMPMPVPYTPSASAPALTRPSYTSNRRNSNPTPQLPPATPRKTPSPPGTPGTKARPTRRRTASESTEEQCSGTTLAGKRCTRPGKAPPGAAYHDSQVDGPIERFCHQHMPSILKPSGYRSGKAGSPLILFDTWIPTYLQDDSKAALRVEMEKPVSQADVPGYIYCFEILNDDTPGYVHFKVGRTTSLKKRIDQWDKQCVSKEQIFLGCWPSNGETSKLKGKLQAGEKGPHCHRVEKLVHLELADVAENTPYLLAGWPKPNLNSLTVNASGSGSGSDSSTPPATPKKKKKSRFSEVKMSGKECPDCGKVHKEIFTFAKATGKNKGKEWDNVVKPIIEKWGNFAETCL